MKKSKKKLAKKYRVNRKRNTADRQILIINFLNTSVKRTAPLNERIHKATAPPPAQILSSTRAASRSSHTPSLVASKSRFLSIFPSLYLCPSLLSVILFTHSLYRDTSNGYSESGSTSSMTHMCGNTHTEKFSIFSHLLSICFAPILLQTSVFIIEHR